MVMYKIRDGVRLELTAAEEAEYNAQQEAYAAASASRKLAEIKSIRNQKFQETDYYALSDVTMSDAMSTYRQNLRNIPQDYTTEDEYDLLLARDEQGNLTHSVWSKP
jgi:hypothetical protein